MPASARKGSPLSLSSSSSGEAERPRSRPSESADAAGPSGAPQPGALEARPDLAGAGHKQGGGPALAPPFVLAAREGKCRLAGQGGVADAGQADPVKAESPAREAAAGPRATPAQAKGRGAAGARGKAPAAPAPSASRAARTPKASASQEAERPLPAAAGDLKAAPALDGAHTGGAAQAAAGPSRAGGGAAGKAGKALASVSEVALVMPERLPTKARHCSEFCMHCVSMFYEP